MKRFFWTLALLFSFTVSGQNKPQFCEQLAALKNLVEQVHYNPKPFDDNFSKNVHQLFLKRLDKDNSYFYESDITKFSDDIEQLDDYILNNNCDFINTYISTFEKRLKASKTIVQSLKNELFDYSGKDTLYYKADNNYDYIKDNIDAKNMWSKRIRYLIVSRTLDRDSVFSNVKASFKELETELRPKVIQHQLCVLDEILTKNGGTETFVKKAFLNAVLAYQDAHSTFFDGSEKATFENSLSTNHMSFGINTEKNNDGDIVIAYIIPGSPAFKNGNLEPNDIIQSLSSGNDYLETFCVSNDDIKAFTNDEKHNSIVFKIKKQNGTIQHIKLTKDRLKVEKNTIQGYLIKGKKTLGYIKIQSFYTDLESPNGLGVANDVAKEIYKLQKEKIDGLIIDLRFNGGGSMGEATDLSGMFIDRGPVSVIKYKNGSTITVKDPNRGSIFIKPILVLVNNFSASASEFFAAALQDYNRAVIVGSPTHGKATAQVILSLGQNDKNLGHCKLTVEKFYRLTGYSHQAKGVIPDIVLPSIYDHFKTRETDMPFALKNDSIVIDVKYRPLQPLPIKELAQKSMNRVKNSSAFQTTQKLNRSIIEEYFNRNTQYKLTLDNIYKERHGYLSLWDQYEALSELKTPIVSFKNTTSANEILKYNTDDLKSNQEFLESLSKNIVLEEAYHILSDYINLTSPN